MLTRLLPLACVLLTTACQSGPDPAVHDAIQVRKLELVDEEGRVRARLGFDQGDSNPHLQLLSTEGRNLIRMVVLDHGHPMDPAPCIQLNNPDGNNVLFLKNNVLGFQGETRIKSNNTELWADDRSGQRLRVGVPGDAEFQVTVPREGMPSLLLRDVDWNVLLAAPGK